MALMRWNDSLSVGMFEIDTQHQRLVKLINDLSDAMKVLKRRDVLKPILSNLTAYTLTHFKTGKPYFDMFRYPDAAARKAEHRAFVQKVSDFKRGFEGGRVATTLPIMNFLKDWLLNHIMAVHQKYTPFLKENGVR
jgi:hemerythrin